MVGMVEERNAGEHRRLADGDVDVAGLELNDRGQQLVDQNATACHWVASLQATGRRHQASEAGRGTFLPLSTARSEFDCGCFRDVQREEPKVKAILSDLYRIGGPHAAKIRASLPN